MSPPLQERLVRPLQVLSLASGLERASAYHERKIQLMLNPLYCLDDDYRRIYGEENYQVGWPEGMTRMYQLYERENAYAILGAQLGDEGKGRITDDVLLALSNIKGIKFVYVTRFQGGSNAGHTVISGDQSLALHQIPAMTFVEKAVGLLESGMSIHPEELMIEYGLIESVVGTDALKDRLIVSRDAILNTDLDRAEETLLDFIESGKSHSTGRGMRTSVAHYFDRTGLQIKNLLADDWEERLGKKYDELAQNFAIRGLNLEQTFVPDYEAIVAGSSTIERPVGAKAEFLGHLARARKWLIEKNLVKYTFPFHKEIYQQVMAGTAGHVFEGAQAIGLHPFLGTLGDNTSTFTDAQGILYATKLWQVHDIAYRIGVFKATYMSSVGRRVMPTQIHLDKKIRTLKQAEDLGLSPDERWAAWIREEAREFGTTTGRPRDICFLDIPMLMYNCYVGGIEMLAATHLDIARKGEKIKVCTHYTNAQGEAVGYVPGLEYLAEFKPHYRELSGWDGAEVRKARTFDELPKEAKQYLAFIQARTGVPIVFSTTGPERTNIIQIPNYGPPSNLLDRITKIKRTFSGNIYSRRGVLVS